MKKDFTTLNADIIHEKQPKFNNDKLKKWIKNKTVDLDNDKEKKGALKELLKSIQSR